VVRGTGKGKIETLSGKKDKIYQLMIQLQGNMLIGLLIIWLNKLSLLQTNTNLAKISIVSQLVKDYTKQRKRD
jgi:hypothetical protein